MADEGEKDRSDVERTGDVTPLRAPRPCPICEKPSTRAFYPFCSKRCKDVDLNRWLSGAYVIPVKEEPGSDDEET